jgi:alpha-galactosidase
MPYYGLANASDPMNNEQARRRIKEQKAIHGPTFAVGDCYQVPADEWSGCSVIESFETSIGCGAQLTTFYRDLAPEQEALWRRWFLLYRKLGLARGEYLNLYDLAFDAPEGHVVRKGRTLYFAFYAPTWAKATPIELRGLEPDVVYDVEDYAREQHLCTVSGPSALLSIGFKDALLVRACPRDA